ncbi:unnamed protein product [Vitrella brassicaformis CCMP3155]|uniref:Uncharacterized protein n=1 Tax=Vitrella brassicaformis (strain CCMP3155) TaxID=1169540 RepID=A0A0G4GW14_VITBC|nr:unnamed protein product [Vitrella brassicaformis CCMP3155]|eukprot:CEM34874.1 unnamed protein product [Vitrella brassicaformis CCMP3155]
MDLHVGQRRYFRILSATEEGVKDAIREATVWRDQTRRRIGWDGTDMSDYTFASREGPKRRRRRCTRVWTFCPLKTRKAGLTGSTCLLDSGEMDMIPKDDVDRAIQMAVEYREWARDEVPSSELAAQAVEEQAREVGEGVAMRTRAMRTRASKKGKREEELPEEDGIQHSETLDPTTVLLLSDSPGGCFGHDP